MSDECSHCGFAIHPDHPKRHFGFHTAHEEYVCTELFKRRIAELEIKVRHLEWVAEGRLKALRQGREERGKMQAQIRELELDAKRIDWMADERIVDGINGVDIDKETLDAVTEAHLGRNWDQGCTDEEWRLEWRNQFRAAVDVGMKSDVKA